MSQVAENMKSMEVPSICGWDSKEGMQLRLGCTRKNVFMQGRNPQNTGGTLDEVDLPCLMTGSG